MSDENWDQEAENKDAKEQSWVEKEKNDYENIKYERESTHIDSIEKFNMQEELAKEIAEENKPEDVKEIEEEIKPEHAKEMKQEFAEKISQEITQDINNNTMYRFWAEQVNPVPQSNKEGIVINHGFDLSGNNQNESNSSNKKKPNILWKATKFFCSAAIFGIVAGGTFLGVNALYYKINPDATPFVLNFHENEESFGGYQLNIAPRSDSDKIDVTTVSNDSIAQSNDISDVVETTMPSIVTITATYTETYSWFGQQYDEESEGGGTGFIVGMNDTELLIATNNHVVEGAEPIKVTFIDGCEAEAIIKGTDAVADLAVISIDLSTIEAETLDIIKIADLGDSGSVKVGQMAVAIGNALGYGQSTTVGYISAVEREVAVSEKTMVLLQTDAAINPGNSGGPLLNMNGEVIGINTVKYASSEVEGMGFAIPISRAMPIINELMNREILAEEEKGYLGIYPNDVTEEIATMYNWPVGVYVTELVEGGAAEKSGILIGDIITKIDDMEVTASTQLRDKVTSYRAGTELKITLMRNNDGTFEEMQIVVTLQESPQLSE